MMFLLGEIQAKITDVISLKVNKVVIFAAEIKCRTIRNISMSIVIDIFIIVILSPINDSVSKKKEKKSERSRKKQPLTRRCNMNNGIF